MKQTSNTPLIVHQPDPTTYDVDLKGVPFCEYVTRMMRELYEWQKANNAFDPLSEPQILFMKLADSYPKVADNGH